MGRTNSDCSIGRGLIGTNYKHLLALEPQESRGCRDLHSWWAVDFFFRSRSRSRARRVWSASTTHEASWVCRYVGQGNTELHLVFPDSSVPKTLDNNKFTHHVSSRHPSSSHRRGFCADRTDQQASGGCCIAPQRPTRYVSFHAFQSNATH